MKRFVEGEDRAQSTLFPERLDDYIAEDNPVRALAVNARDRNFTQNKIKSRLEHLEEAGALWTCILVGKTRELP
jgi:hypothetical protein